jgi:hypothetical protein
MRSTIVLAVLLMADTVSAQIVPKGVALREVGADRPSTLTFHCDRDWESKVVKALCTFVNTSVSKPDLKDVKKALEEVKATAVRKVEESQESADKFWASACFLRADIDKKELAQLQPLQRKIIQRLVEACNMRSLPKLLEWYDFTWQLTADTCTVHTLYPKSGVFIQKDENKWEGIDGDDGPFHRGGTVVMTIWRSGKDGHWNYREVRAGEVNCESDALHDCREPGVVDWQWDAPKPGLECKYVTTD